MTQLLNTLLLGCRYMLTALGVSLIYRVTGCIDFGQASMYMLGAYLAYTYTVRAHLPFAIGLPLAILTTAFVGLSVDLLIYRSLRRYTNGMLAVMLASLGVVAVVQNTVSLIFQDVTYSLSPQVALVGWQLAGDVRVTLNQVIIISCAAMLFIADTIARRRSRLALVIEAVAIDRSLAATIGVPTERILSLATFAGSGLSALAGALISLEVDIQPSIGTDALLSGILITLLAGAGRMGAALLAGLFVAVLETVAATNLSLLWRQTIAFTGVLLVMHLRWTRQRPWRAGS